MNNGPNKLLLVLAAETAWGSQGFKFLEYIDVLNTCSCAGLDNV